MGVKQVLVYTKEQSKKAHAELDSRLSEFPSVCSQGCDACCYQMVAVHSWEEELICSYIENSMHADLKRQVRRQLLDWWRYLKTILRSSSRADPITFDEYRQLQHHMIHSRVMCPFLVGHKCSIYSVRPGVCRSHFVSSEPTRCLTEAGRVGDSRAFPAFLDVYGPESEFFPVDVYFHGMKPLPFLVTGVFKLPVPSTPVQGFGLGDLFVR